MPNAPEFRQLTKAEEAVMQSLWSAGQGFVKDVVAGMPAPQPHYNTVSTLLKILTEKGFVATETLGNATRYTPLIRREDYRKRFAKTLLKGYFNNSLANLVSAFAEKGLSAKEMDAIMQIIQSKSAKK